jgi:hypothetical protein
MRNQVTLKMEMAGMLTVATMLTPGTILGQGGSLKFRQ